MNKELVFALIAIVLYYIAPDQYNWPFCALCMVVFLVDAFLCILPKLKKKEYFSFNIVFFFTYFWTSFAYPVLVYGTQTDRENRINRAIDWDLLSHTSALALLFITIYILGYTYYKKSKEYKQMSFVNQKVPYTLYMLVFVAYIGAGILGFRQSGGVNMSIGKYLIDVYFTIYAICLYVNVNNNREKYKNTFANFFKVNKALILSGIMLFFAFIVMGDRMPAIKVLLTLICVYYFFWNKIQTRKLIMAGLILLPLMFFVRQTRSSSNNLASGNVTGQTIEKAFDLENGMLYMFADLFFINRELCLGYEYSQKNDLYYPERLLITPLNPFPVLPSLVSTTLWGITPSEMDTGLELNGLLDQNYNIEGHLGNHPASDLLMSFGLFGMLVVAYLLGRCVGYIETKKYSNFYIGISYIVLMGWSMYLARSVTFSLVRPIGYVFLFGYLLYRIPIINKYAHMKKRKHT